jgi:hypothetical protein
LAANFPKGSDRYLRDLTVSAITVDWLAKEKSWTCKVTNVASSSVGEARKRTGCGPRGQTADYLKVTIAHDANAKVRSVNVRCDYGPGNRTCRRLFTDLVDVVMAGDERQRSQAIDWARTNVDSDETTIIGGIRLAATLSPHYLDITPAG